MRFHDITGFASWLKLGFSSNGLISPLQKALGSNCPSFPAPLTSHVRALRSENFFHVKPPKILGLFGQSYECLFPEIVKNPSKSSFWCHFRFFLTLKFKYLQTVWPHFQKWADSEILPLTALSKHQIILIVSILVWPA